jgi:hypothetical protein
MWESTRGTLNDLPIIEWDHQAPTALENPSQHAYRVRTQWDKQDMWEDVFHVFLQQAHVDQVAGLVVGSWMFEGSESLSSEGVVQALVGARRQLPNLRAVFVGDIDADEWQISWIEQTDLSPLFTAYPSLTYFGCRGGNNLELGAPQHDHLQRLVVESGGTAAQVVRQLGDARLPSLQHLELWIGTRRYGRTVNIQDIEYLLTHAAWPNLRTLALRNADIADEIAQLVPTLPIMGQIETLDLSLGTLSDVGAAALLTLEKAAPRLQTLDLHHNYCSEAMLKHLEALPYAVKTFDARTVGVSRRGEEMRFVAVGE